MPPAPPPRPSLSFVRGPPVPHTSCSGGGQTWRRVRGFWLTGWLVVGRAECGNMPPALRAAPQRWASCCRLCRARGHAPRAFGAAPRSGAISWLLQRWRFAPESFENCGELHEGTRREPRRPNPRQEAHQTWGAAPKARGACPRNLHNRRKEQNASLAVSHPVSQKPRTQRQVCPPPERQ